MCMQKRSVRSVTKNVLPSVADPSMAQSGRDLVFNPKPINYNRCDYYKGVPADQIQSFDQMYAQKIDVFQAAKEHSDKTKKHLDTLQKKYEESQKKPAESDPQ